MIRAKTEVPMASTDRKESALKMFLNQDQRAVWILGFGPACKEKGQGAQETGWMEPRNC